MDFDGTRAAHGCPRDIECETLRVAVRNQDTTRVLRSDIWNLTLFCLFIPLETSLQVVFDVYVLVGVFLSKGISPINAINGSMWRRLHRQSQYPRIS